MPARTARVRRAAPDPRRPVEHDHVRETAELATDTAGQRCRELRSGHVADAGAEQAGVEIAVLRADQARRAEKPAAFDLERKEKKRLPASGATDDEQFAAMRLCPCRAPVEALVQRIAAAFVKRSPFRFELGHVRVDGDGDPIGSAASMGEAPGRMIPPGAGFRRKGEIGTCHHCRSACVMQPLKRKFR